MSQNPPNEFERLAAKPLPTNLVAELYHFFLNNKKWWLLPIIVVLLFIGSILLLSTTAAAPFIYTIF